MTATTKRRITHRKLGDLKPFPCQAEFFPDMPHAEMCKLARSMEETGLAHEVEILPDNTIIAGHQRVRAARHLAWETIRCWIRDDLAKAGEAAIMRRFLEDNAARRQLTMLEKARCYRELKRLKGTSFATAKGNVRDALAARFQKGPRTMARWERLLDTPREVQDAVEAGRLQLTTGGKVAGLESDAQQAIAERIRNGEAPAKVVQEYVSPPKARSTASEVNRLVKMIEQVMDAQVCGRLDETHLGHLRPKASKIRKFKEFLGQLMTKIDVDARQAEALLQEACAKFRSPRE
jgi:ParB-like chromosome segregation protein Spo0J